MKLEKWFSCLISALLAFCIAFAGAGCLVTGFSITFVNMEQLMLLCGIFAVLSSICFCFRWGGLVLISVIAIAIGYFLREGQLLLQVEALLYHISKFYNTYGWGIIQWSGAYLPLVNLTGALAIIAAVAAIAVSWTVCRQKPIILGILAGFLPLAACCIVTDTVPKETYLFLLLAGQALLLLTQMVRRSSPKDAARLTALLLVPVMAATMLLFRLVPQKGYEIQSFPFQEQLSGLLNNIPLTPDDALPDLKIPVSQTVKKQIYLTSVGPRPQTPYAVMDVVADQGGVLYLRGQSYEVYSRQAWSYSVASSLDDEFWPNKNMADAGKVNISTRSIHGLYYAPYFPEGYLWKYTIQQGMLKNIDKDRTYSFQRLVPTSAYDTLDVEPHLFETSELLQKCSQLPDSTLRDAQDILREIFPNDLSSYGAAEKARMICQYVRSSATYDLDTPKMPSPTKDFAIWFLKDSATGYCIHFASAAAVLLRAAGVPSRYITGYMVEVEPGVRKVVSEDMAHAWVEYLDPNRGWTILEATPSAPETDDPEPTPPPVTDPTENSEATGPSAGTQPEDSQGTGHTDPEDTNRPTVNTPEGPGASRPDLLIPGILVGIVGALLLIAGQYFLRCRIRRKAMHTGSRNQRALCRWRYAARMEKLTGLQPPEKLAELADKAMFSQHTLTAGEVMEFDLWLEEARKVFRKKPLLRQLLMRLIWAID